jgi:hypothetical protein
MGNHMDGTTTVLNLFNKTMNIPLHKQGVNTGGSDDQ